MLRIAITRMQPEAEKTAARVRALGGEAIVAPLLSFAPLPFDARLHGVQALLFTSANGVRAFADASVQRDRTVLTVGDTTAGAALDAGFADVRSADGDVAALAAMAAATLDPQAGALLYISGADIARDLVAMLTVDGFCAERRIAYEARAAAALPPALTAPFDLILFHSARSANIFVALGAPGADKLAAICLSQTVADAAARVHWGKLIVAPAPREEALLQAAFTAKLAPGGANA